MRPAIAPDERKADVGRACLKRDVTLSRDLAYYSAVVRPAPASLAFSLDSIVAVIAVNCTVVIGRSFHARLPFRVGSLGIIHWAALASLIAPFLTDSALPLFSSAPQWRCAHL